MSEKRRYHRLKISLPFSYSIPPSKKAVETATLDICGTGLAFVTHENLKTRQEILMYLLIPGHKKVEVHARVARVEQQDGADASNPQYKVGVRIMDPIKFDESQFIKFYADKLLEYFGKGQSS